MTDINQSIGIGGAKVHPENSQIIRAEGAENEEDESVVDLLEQKSKSQREPFKFNDYLSLRAIFEDNLPLETLKELPKRVRYVFGTVAYCIFFGSFFAFAVLGYIDARNGTFISLDKSAHDCKEVDVSVSGSFYATADGEWDGFSNFLFRDALYRYDFKDLQVNNAQFERMMLEDFDISALSDYLETHDLVDNLVALMHFKRETKVRSRQQTLSMLTTASDVFNRVQQEAVVQNASFNCSAVFTHFDVATARLRLDFEPAVDNSRLDDGNRVCQELIGPLTNNFVSAGDEIPLILDMHSFSAAVAVNLGVLRKKDLEKIQDLDSISVNGFNYFVESFFDPRNSHASVIYCLTAKQSSAPVQQLCVLEINGQPALPFLAHGEEGCNSCSSSSSPESDGENGETDDVFTIEIDPCNEFNLIASFVFSELSVSEGGLDQLLQLYHNIDTDNFKDELRKNFAEGAPLLFEQCPQCGVLHVHGYDDLHSVTEFSHPLTRGHCRSPLSNRGHQLLAATPPVNLVEDYYECRDGVYEAFMDATGIAFGNMEVFGTAGLLLLLLTALLASKFEGWGEEDEDEESILQQELKEFAKQMRKVKSQADDLLPDFHIQSMLHSILSTVAAATDSNEESSGGDIEAGAVAVAATRDGSSGGYVADTSRKSARIDDNGAAIDESSGSRRIVVDEAVLEQMIYKVLLKSSRFDKFRRSATSATVDAANKKANSPKKEMKNNQSTAEVSQATVVAQKLPQAAAADTVAFITLSSSQKQQQQKQLPSSGDRKDDDEEEEEDVNMYISASNGYDTVHII